MPTRQVKVKPTPEKTPPPKQRVYLHKDKVQQEKRAAAAAKREAHKSDRFAYKKAVQKELAKPTSKKDLPDSNRFSKKKKVNPLFKADAHGAGVGALLMTPASLAKLRHKKAEAKKAAQQTDVSAAEQKTDVSADAGW